MKSLVHGHVNVGLIAGVLFVLLTYLVVSQQTALSRPNGKEPFAQCHGVADFLSQFAYWLFLNLQLSLRYHSGYRLINSRMKVPVKQVSTLLHTYSMEKTGADNDL